MWSTIDAEDANTIEPRSRLGIRHVQCIGTKPWYSNFSPVCLDFSQPTTIILLEQLSEQSWPHILSVATEDQVDTPSLGTAKGEYIALCFSSPERPVLAFAAYRGVDRQGSYVDFH